MTLEPLDLFEMRERYNRQQIMLCFNGPISRSLIEEIGNALRNYLTADQATPSSALDVFAIYIEMTQNIRHYAHLKNWTEQEAGATVVVSRDDAGHYVVSAGNVVTPEDGERLVGRVQSLAGLDKVQLKAAYKEQLRKPRDDPHAASGAGLGLIDMARKASEPLQASLRSMADGRSFLSMRAVV